MIIQHYVVIKPIQMNFYILNYEMRKEKIIILT